MNTVFEPIPPMTPIVVPGVGESASSAAVGQNAALMGGAIMREAAFAHVTVQATVESAGLNAGNAVAQGNMAPRVPRAPRNRRRTARNNASQQTDKPQQGVQMATQMVSQMGSMAAQIPQQIGQMVTQPLQQLSQPLQQVTQIFSQMGSGFGSDKGAQIGLIGASPMSQPPAGRWLGRQCRARGWSGRRRCPAWVVRRRARH